jgi:RNA binding exosome subunit
MEAVQRILPEEHLDEIKFKRRKLKGHYGNPIRVIETKIKKKEILSKILEKLSEKLNEIDKDLLGREIDRYIHKGSFFLRLDKQAAFQNEIRIQSADPIHLRIRFRKDRTKDIYKICKEMGLVP